MSLGLIKPGASVALRHPKTGALLTPLYVRKDGSAVWPVLGAASDDPDDPAFTGGGAPSGSRRVVEEDDDDEDEEDDEEEDEKSKKPSSRKSSKDEDDDDDDLGDEKYKATRQAKRYRLALRAEQAKTAELNERLKALENKDKPQDEVTNRELSETKAERDKLRATNAELSAQLAFFSANTVAWADPNDAFALAQREGLFDDVIDEDGTVDQRELRRGLRDLAKRKPHLVKLENDSKAGGRKSNETDNEEEEEEPRSPRTMNSSRRGSKGTTPTRAELAKKFPVLRG